MRKIGAAVGVMAIIALGAYTYGTVKQVKYAINGPTTINVTGKGEVFAKPDIATFSFSVEAKDASASVAQSNAAETMNGIIAYLGEAGVEEKDVKTEYYNLTPQYEYPETVCYSGYCPPRGEPKLIGYQVTQSIAVKVRDTAKAGDILSGIGSKGATNVSGLSFTIDDEDSLKAQAREAAIADAKAKAKELANDLGVRLVRMTGYWEDQSGPQPYYGMGGDMVKTMSLAEEAPAVAPQLPTGENKVATQVNITYEIRSRGW